MKIRMAKDRLTFGLFDIGKDLRRKYQLISILPIDRVNFSVSTLDILLRVCSKHNVEYYIITFSF